MGFRVLGLNPGWRLRPQHLSLIALSLLKALGAHVRGVFLGVVDPGRNIILAKSTCLTCYLSEGFSTIRFPVSMVRTTRCVAQHIIAEKGDPHLAKLSSGCDSSMTGQGILESLA